MSCISYGSSACLGRLNSRVVILNLRLLSQLQQVAVNAVDKNDKAPPSLYPPIKPRFPPGLWGQMTDKHAWKWHDKGVEVLKTATLPERLEALAGTEEKGYWQAAPFIKRRHALAGIQYMTKTRVKRSLPESYQKLGSTVDENALKISRALIHELFAQDAMVKANDTKVDADKEERDSATRAALLRQLVTFMSSLSAAQNPALNRCQVAERAYVESAWQRWGYKYPDIRTTTKDEGGLRVQSSFRPDFMLRTEHPLSPVLKTVDELLTEADAGPIPDFTYAPNCLGLRTDTIKPTWLPGFKPGDPCEFGALQIVDISSFLSGAESELNFKNQPHIVQELVEACATMAGFTWASALAHYQGFSMFHDLTYPICVQTVLTDTRRFMFSTYQLNTLALFKDGKSANGNLRENACWLTNLMPLSPPSEAVPTKLSDDVIRLLLSYFRYPTDAQNPPLEKRRPYLPDCPSPLVISEPIISPRVPVPPEVQVVDEFWKV